MSCTQNLLILLIRPAPRKSASRPRNASSLFPLQAIRCRRTLAATCCHRRRRPSPSVGRPSLSAHCAQANEPTRRAFGATTIGDGSPVKHLLRYFIELLRQLPADAIIVSSHAKLCPFQGFNKLLRPLSLSLCSIDCRILSKEVQNVGG